MDDSLVRYDSLFRSDSLLFESTKGEEKYLYGLSKKGLVSSVQTMTLQQERLGVVCEDRGEL
jgi:hypothetical protein